jgi:excisionase family DNA binding protein
MTTHPQPGDLCPRCGRKLVVYCSIVVGKSRVRYVGCRRYGDPRRRSGCGWTSPDKVVIPLDTDSNAVSGAERIGDKMGVIETTQPERDAAMSPTVLTARQVAQRLQLSRVTVWRRTKDGTLPVVRIGKSTRYPLEQIERLERGEHGPKPT